MTNGLALWQLQIIKTFHLSILQIGLVNAIQFAVVSLAIYLWGRHSDQTGAFPLLLGVTASMYVTHLWPMLLCITITVSSMIKGSFWAMATEMLPASSAAVV